MMKTLHMFVGVPGSKRKEEAKKFAENNHCVYLSSDDFRKENPELSHSDLFSQMTSLARKILSSGKDVVFDATNLYSKQRKAMLNNMRAERNICHYYVDTFENCVERDSLSSDPVGKDIVLQKFLTAEIPFEKEGWDEVVYHTEPLNPEYRKSVITENKEKMLLDKEMSVELASFFMETGKVYLEELDEKMRVVGYNNASAQIAFQWMIPYYNVSFIEEVVTLILYTKRVRGSNEKGIEKLKSQIGEDLYKKVLLLA